MESIAELIAHPEQLNKDTLHGLRELVAKYPYYQAARLLFLKNLFLLHDPLFGEELRRAAIYLPDRRVLFKMVEGDNYKIQPTPLHKDEDKKQEAGDRTQSLIDKFLRTALPEEASSASTPHHKPTAADATGDYAAFLLQLDDAEPAEGKSETASDRSTELIDDFIGKKPERIQLQDDPQFKPELQNDEKDEADDSAEDGYLTMTLAKIYIKQQRYEKALEIIRKVNLNNPKKSSYFADQIRFLQKLIVNKNHEKAE